MVHSLVAKFSTLSAAVRLAQVAAFGISNVARPARTNLDGSDSLAPLGVVCGGEVPVFTTVVSHVALRRFDGLCSELDSSPEVQRRTGFDARRDQQSNPAAAVEALDVFTSGWGNRRPVR